MLAVYGDRPVVLVRELTKIYEEYTRGSISELVAFLEENPLKGECLLIVEGAKEEELDLEEVDLIQEIDTLVQEGMKKNQAIKQVAKQYGLQKSELYARYHQELGKVGSRMEIRMAYPNEIKRIMEIIQDAKESLAQRQVDQWQDGYPDEEIIFEDILESRGYVAVEDQEVVAYAAVYKGNEAAYNEIYDGKWEHDNYMYVTFHRVAVAKEAAGKGVAQTFLQGLIEGGKRTGFPLRYAPR